MFLFMGNRQKLRVSLFWLCKLVHILETPHTIVTICYIAENMILLCLKLWNYSEPGKRNAYRVCIQALKMRVLFWSTTTFLDILDLNRQQQSPLFFQCTVSNFSYFWITFYHFLLTHSSLLFGGGCSIQLEFSLFLDNVWCTFFHKKQSFCSRLSVEMV